MDCDLSRKTAIAGKALTRPPAAAASQNAWPGSMERDFVLSALDSAAIVAITDVSGTTALPTRNSARSVVMLPKTFSAPITGS